MKDEASCAGPGRNPDGRAVVKADPKAGGPVQPAGPVVVPGTANRRPAS